MKATHFLVVLLAATSIIFSSQRSSGAEPNPPSASSPKWLTEYFRAETRRLSQACLPDGMSLKDWTERRETLRQQLYEMLSLSPLPERTPLNPVITGVVEQEGFRVENLHFQSMPGLYVTGNLYLPKRLDRPAPAILYVCGHANMVDPDTGAILGNKTGYRHHGEWFARNGYVCLTIDTVQLGEIKGIHHGTYREKMWWWNSRGYSSAGVEAWNGIRALDYLESRPEVDVSRLGVTGRSGGGAYSWWVTALDERIKAAAPVAGITDLQNHVVDGTVEGHCDCMFMVNTYGWDYPLVAALAAPRPLLIANSDKDSIFPLDGVVRLHAKVARIYKLYGATNNLGLLITEGPHEDTQDLQLPVFRWFNRHLKGEDPLIDMAAKSVLKPAELRVFKSLPADECTSRIQETFVPKAAPLPPPDNAAEWVDRRDVLKAALREKVFRAWPDQAPDLGLALQAAGQTRSNRLEVYQFTSQANVPLRLYVVRPDTQPRSLRLTVCGPQDWPASLARMNERFPGVLRQEIASLNAASSQALPGAESTPEGLVEALLAPRGVGLSAWNVSDKADVQIRRRFMLLGQTLDSMRVWDIRRGLQALRAFERSSGIPITIQAKGEMGVNALYAVLFESNVTRLQLDAIPASHMQGPDYLNVLRFLDVPQAVAMAAESTAVELIHSGKGDWSYPAAVVSNLAWPSDRFKLVP